MDLAWLILFFPLAGVLANALLGRWLDRRIVAALATGAVAASFLVAVLVLVEMLGWPADSPTGGNGRERIVPLFSWIAAGDLQVEVRLLFDQLSILMTLVVTGVSTLIHAYSAAYMRGDVDYKRYFTWLNLFVLSMLVLVLGDSFLTLYAGWEGVGLCSFLLIGYWFEREAPAAAAKKAFLVNRVGDVGLALGIMLIFATFGSLSFAQVLPVAGSVLSAMPGAATAIALLLFLGAVAKSAQVPLHVWLPDAMEGPTPVSALIHAATMVTAGVYLVARCHTLFEASGTALTWVAWTGTLTALFAATVAMVQQDLKRVLAYSTISQLGTMFLAAGVGAYAAGLFHLTTHAFFKALLFLAAGSVMHALHGELDIFKMGGLRKKLPWTFGTFLVGILALAAIPPFAGFWSKDEILVAAFHSGNIALWLVATVTGGITTFYAFRLLFVAFGGQTRLDKKAQKVLHESGPAMIVPMVLLAILAALGGLLGLPEWLGLGNAVDEFLHPVFAGAHAAAPVAGATDWLPVLLSLLAAGTGLAAAYWLYLRRPGLAVRWRSSGAGARLYDLVLAGYRLDHLYQVAVVRPLRALGDLLAGAVEAGIIDGAVNGLARLAGLAGEGLRRLQSGLVRHYALAMLAGAVLVLLYFLLARAR
jgi:NADH-quinone oxidoreductase subunit L